MERFTLHTYQNRDEFEKFYKQKEDDGYIISPFIFQETKELLEKIPETIIDISNLVEYLLVNTADIVPAMNNFRPANEDTQFIIVQSLAEQALEMFRLYFKDKVPLYPIKNVQEQEPNELAVKTEPFKRDHLYSYKSSNELDRVIKYLNEKDIPLVSFSQINDAFIKDFKKNIKDQKEIFVDITSLVLAIKDNPSLNYYAEKILIENPNLKAIIYTDQVKGALEVFRFVFDEVQPIYELITIEREEVEVLEDKTVKIVDLTKDEVERTMEEISNNLFGHKKFKDQLSSAISNFIFLNRIKENKVFSIFLLGDTGLGKSEFATLLKNQLNPDTPLIKINFGNYSSQDALNSLIGSPRGYRGSEEGELSKKILKSKAGVILCDEFEKANKQIFHFFLELLEAGVFTDSLSREYNLDGYIIIFTSNLDKTQFYKKIPAELQSRLDLVFEFCPLSDSEKKEFVNYFVDNFVEKVKKAEEESLNLNLSTQTIEQVKNTNIRDVGNIRDIKRILVRKILKGY
ncbi:AAA family ATPase [Virgibacillus sp. LDC-1]|uniref:AAA family ATPase n=1 Tax=Virgibacillus sp. LDC-1 TaxID=3039856 RepID=UPI0024DEF064|nr:AAA family ATPase [Virgibacillus sp. LDC-1]